MNAKYQPEAGPMAMKALTTGTDAPGCRMRSVVSQDAKAKLLSRTQKIAKTTRLLDAEALGFWAVEVVRTGTPYRPRYRGARGDSVNRASWMPLSSCDRESQEEGRVRTTAWLSSSLVGLSLPLSNSSWSRSTSCGGASAASRGRFSLDHV